MVIVHVFCLVGLSCSEELRTGGLGREAPGKQKGWTKKIGECSNRLNIWKVAGPWPGRVRSHVLVILIGPPYPPPRDLDLKLGYSMVGRGLSRRWPMVFSRIASHLFLCCFISLDLQLIVPDFECQNAPKIDPKSSTKLDAHWTCLLFRICDVFLQDSLWTSNLSAYWNLSKHLCFKVKMQMHHFLYDVTCCYVVY